MEHKDKCNSVFCTGECHEIEEEMNDSREMPDVIYATPDCQWESSDYCYLLGDGEHYTHTARLLESVRDALSLIKNQVIMYDEKGFFKPSGVNYHGTLVWHRAEAKTALAKIDAILKGSE